MSYLSDFRAYSTLFDRKAHFVHTAIGLLAGLTVILPGCFQSSTSIGLKDLESPNLDVRIQAIKWAGDNKVKEAVPLLVDRLQEQDKAVRFFAIEALKRIMNTDHGFDYKADAASRAQAIQRWRETLGQPQAPATP
jgi:hypothetical protein